MKAKIVFGIMAVTALGTMAATACLAATGFGGIGENIGSQSAGMASGAMKIGFFIGLCLVLASVITFATMSKTNVQAKVPASMLAAGIILVSLSAFITSGSETIWGSDQTSGAQTSLNLKSN